VLPARMAEKRDLISKSCPRYCYIEDNIDCQIKSELLLLRTAMRAGIISLFLPFVFLVSTSHAQQLTWESTLGPDGGPVTDLFMLPDSSLIALSNAGRVYRSDNRAQLWYDITPPSSTINRLVAASDGTLVASDVGPSTYSTPAQQRGLYRSTNGGLSWQPIQVDTLKPAVWNLWQGAEGRILAGTDHGLYWSEDRGMTWNWIERFPRTHLRNLAAHPSGEVVVYYGGQIHRSRDTGETWQVFDIVSGDPDLTWMAVSQDGALFGRGSAASVLFRSLDDGQTWSRIEILETSYSIERLITDAGGDRLFVDTNLGLYESEDRGASWQLNDFPFKYVLCAKRLVSGAYLFCTESGVVRQQQQVATLQSHGIDQFVSHRLATTGDGIVYVLGFHRELWRWDPALNHRALVSVFEAAVALDAAAPLDAGAS